MTILPTRLRLLGKQSWYSVCSMHRTHTKECYQCNVGSWHTDWVLAVSKWAFKKYQKLWTLWTNLGR
jgi:hypothetical protein